MQSLSLVLSECFVSGRGQGHVSNFYIVDLENFATASRRYTGDIQVIYTTRMVSQQAKSVQRLRAVTDNSTDMF